MKKNKTIVSLALSAALVGGLVVPSIYPSGQVEPNALKNDSLNVSNFTQTSFSEPKKITPEMEAESVKNAIEVVDNTVSINLSDIGFSEPKKITPEMEAESVRNSIMVTPEINADPGVTPFAQTNVFYKFSKLGSGAYIESDGNLVITTTTDIDLTLVQSPDYGHKGTAHLYYKLINQGSGSDSAELGVKGNYTDENATITFPSLKAGTYKVQISNYSRNNPPQSKGNGYTR